MYAPTIPRKVALLLVFLAGYLAATTAHAQWWNETRFGRNKVNYQQFHWQRFDTQHFQIYYYQGEGEIAKVGAQIAEDAYARISATLGYRVSSPIPILIYDSHNDFEQTNAIWGLIDEGTLAVTEALKNRVVVPFIGSYTEFRHAMHHEIVHAFMFDMFYRREGGLGTASRLWWGPPLWFAEGLAEYLSTDWTTEKNMWVRGAAIDGYLRLDGYQAYTAGYSLLRWIADEFGSDKIPAITRRMAITKDPNGAFTAELGVTLDELLNRWERHLKRFYWPEVDRREFVDEVAKPLTNHESQRQFYNHDPAIAPQGDRIAFLSDRDEYASLYIMSAIDGRILRKVLTGEKSGHFEEMHWLRGGISWSPEGNRLTFAAKHKNADALYIVRANDGHIMHHFQWSHFNSIYSPSWSPDSVHIAFIGVHEGRGDLYVLDLRTQSLTQLTNDLYDESDPEWSPDGQEIVFSSDRPSDPAAAMGAEVTLGDTTIVPVGNDQNIFILTVATGKVRQVTSAAGDDISPTWSPDSRYVAFTSDRNGIYNIYIADLDSGTTAPVTNVLNGVFSPSWSVDGRKLAFAGFQKMGYDIYVMSDPLTHRKSVAALEPAAYIERRIAAEKADSSGYHRRPPLSGLGNFSFTLHPTDSTGAPLAFAAKPYSVHFTPDLLTGLILFDNVSGLTAQSLLLVSDTMGDHQIMLYTNIHRNIEDADFELDYRYLKSRLNFGFNIFQYHQYYLRSLVATEWTSDRIYGVGLLMSYPLSKFTRIEGELDLSGRERAFFSLNDANSDLRQQMPSVRTLSPMVSLVQDNTLWGATGPENGSRAALIVKHTPQIGFNTFAYTTVTGDWRHYRRLGGDYSLATRIAAGGSSGRDPGRFLLGGINYWINFHYATYDVTNDSLVPITDFAGPLRGGAYGELRGSRFGLINLEFRYPLVRQLAWGWPIPLVLRNIRGILFLDVGTTWGNGRGFAPLKKGGGLRLNYNPGLLGPQALGGFGFGWRMNLGSVVLKWDIAWPTDLKSTLGGSRQYWSIGADF